MHQHFEFAQPPPRLEAFEARGRRIVIGTCGYSYADWVGPFYPAGTKQRDMLAYYAQRFTAVEIDSSYYGVPSRASFENMHRRTPDAFRFAVKLPGTLTHAPAGATAELHPDAALLRENLRPLVEAGKLAALLAQFPNGFRASEAAWDVVRRLRDAFAELPLAVEFRNREWQTNATLRALAELGIAWTNVDEPQFAGLLRPSSDVAGELAYVRFHGRNYAQWWRPEHRDERYRYRYERLELAPWADRIVDMTEHATTTLAFFNNHKLANATLDAFALAELLREKIE